MIVTVNVAGGMMMNRLHAKGLQAKAREDRTKMTEGGKEMETGIGIGEIETEIMGGVTKIVVVDEGVHQTTTSMNENEIVTKTNNANVEMNAMANEKTALAPGHLAVEVVHNPTHLLHPQRTWRNQTSNHLVC